jgi:hypothetical protein
MYKTGYSVAGCFRLWWTAPPAYRGCQQEAQPREDCRCREASRVPCERSHRYLPERPSPTNRPPEGVNRSVESMSADGRWDITRTASSFQGKSGQGGLWPLPSLYSMMTVS